MKLPTTNRELIAAYKRLQVQNRQVYTAQYKLRDTAAKRCKLKFGQIVDVKPPNGR